MKLRLRTHSSNGLRRSTVAIAFLAAMNMAMRDASVWARPRAWADQDTAATRQPSWMPFSLSDRTPNPAVARITTAEGNVLSQGSGTLVEARGERALVVTNWHVIRDAKGPVVATFPDGFRSAATVLKVDKDWDLAALLIWRPNATPIAISMTAPRPGDPLTIAGYGSGNYRAVQGRCTQYVAPGTRMPYEMVEVSAEARQGDSGGPILNARGELAGVLFGAGGGTTSGTFCGRVKWFVESAWPVEQVQEADILVSVPARQPNTHWPSDGLVAIPQVAIPQVATPPKRPVTEPTPNYSNGSPLVPATISAGELDDSTAKIDFNTLAGATPIEQAKTLLAAIGILAVVVQVTRIIGGGKRVK